MSKYKLAVSITLIALLGGAAFGQEAKLPVKVSPQQAYVFFDGVAIRDGNVTLKTTPGEHTIAVYNYGFKEQVRKVTLQAGSNAPEEFKLEPAGEKVTGAYGFIQIEGPGRAAVLLNGTTPEYLVGHVDEFNNHIVWSQQLMVPPGTHQLMVTQQGNTIWSGPIQVGVGERVIVYVPSGNTKRQAVDSGASPGRPRFEAGTASAAVSVAPVAGTLTATPGQINCNERSRLAYSSVDTLHSSIKDDADTKALSELSGELPVSPRRSTTYVFEASGPGGLVKHDATVTVNPTVQSSLEAVPGDIHYLRIGNKVLTQEASELKWTATNADSISVEPIGKVEATGAHRVTPEPKAATGTINESVSYTLTATNVCGGSDSKTAQLQIKGMIEPFILSVFFPTGYPSRKHPDTGLLASQQEQLMKVANVFPLYAEHTPEAKILVHAYADPRGTDEYNLQLSERRAAVVRNFLISHGIAEDKITVDALGESNQLDAATIDQLEAESPFKVEEAKKHNQRATRLGYNRRIDLEVQPADMETSRFFPHGATDADLLLQAGWPSREKLISAHQTSAIAGGSGSGNQ